MNLAQLMNNALTNPQYRLALVSGTVQEVPGVSTEELAAAVAVLKADIKGSIAEFFKVIPTRAWE